ncbi:SMP-30/gluconolactonase/LRE family protein [Streptomyces sp. NPDC059785]|uniref:SMP-30/gluconolactonase/LRE family protein n=1 Tax=Streptomyces sp. NPDC059785 TaxID=3346945 RepID=UPI00366225F1
MTPFRGSARPGTLTPRRYVRIGGQGPEDVVADDRGRVLTGVADGRVLRIDGLTLPGSPRVEELARTGGRPLGLALHPDGSLLVCDAERGLLAVDPEHGTVRVLADSAAGEPLRFCSNATVLSDGTVCFTVSSRRHPLEHWIGDLVEHTGTGRLLRLAPDDKEPEVVVDGLRFAGGVAASADESFLVVAETGARRLTRVRLTGPAAGRHDVLADDLPGAPDNISRTPGGPLWVALAGPRVPGLDLLHRRGPGVRRAAARAALRVPYRPTGYAGVLAVDDHGRTVHHLERRHGGFRMVTAVCETGGRLVLGSMWEAGVAVCEPPATG